MKRRTGFAVAMLAGTIFCAPYTVIGATSESDVSTNLGILTQTKSCRDCNLRGVNLNRANLAGADLEGANLAGAKLHLADLSGANLKNSNLEGASLGGADLSGADLRGAKLGKRSLDGAYADTALFTDDENSSKDDIYEKSEVNTEETENQQVEDVIIEEDSEPEIDPVAVTVETGAQEDVGKEVDVVEETPRGKEEAAQENSESASISQSTPTVTQAAEEIGERVQSNNPKSKAVPQIETATVEEADEPKDEAVVTVGMVEETTGPTSEEADSVLEESVTVETEALSPMEKDAVINAAVEAAEEAVSDVPVVDAKTIAQEKLLDTNKCYECDLAGLDFSGANFKNADLEKADLTGCNFSGASFKNANLKGAILVNTDLRNADLRGADFYRADLSGSDLTGAKVEETIFEDTYMSNITGMVQESIMYGPVNE